MKISHKVVDEIIHIERRYTRLTQIFAGFVERAQYLVGENSRLKVLKLKVSADGSSLDAIFAGIHLRFQLLPGYGEDGSVRGWVVCSRQIPGLYKESDILGSFTFLGNGNTDFEVEQGGDPIEMEYHAIEIVLHFVQMAIQKPLLGLVV